MAKEGGTVKLYDSNGYLNIPEIDRTASRQGISFLIIIGARQVGKTYGTLKHMIDDNRRFILMRRTQTESDFIASGAIAPFSGMGYTDMEIKRDSKYTSAIYKGDDRIGTVMALSTVAKIRGFSGADYTDLVFDEFIPESHVMRMKNEGDAFLNAIVTISGNRELEDKPPLKVWLLANSNNLASPILFAFGLTEKIESMMSNGQEVSFLPEKGIAIILPDSAEVIGKRKKTTLFKALGGASSRFTEMAYDNDFSYNDAENVQHVNLTEFKPMISTVDGVTVYKAKSGRRFYVGSYRRGARVEVSDTERGRAEFLKHFPDARMYYIKNAILFESLTVKEKFLLTIGINK